MNPLIDNLHIVELTNEQTFISKEDAIDAMWTQMKKGFAIEYEEYWQEYFPIYIVRWYKIVK